MATREIVVNMVPGGVTPVIHVSQYDDGYGITANLIENSGTYTVPVGATVSIEGTKPDGHGYSYLCTYQDNAVVIPVKTQMTAVKGKHSCELVVRKEGLRVGSKNMIMVVEVAGLGEDTVISDTELPAIIVLAQEQEEAAQEAAETAQEAAAQVLSSQIVTDASGSIASFSDGADDVAVKSLVATITPVQSGSGDPSPSNIRPISGRTGLTVTVCGVNVWDEDYALGVWNAAGVFSPNTSGYMSNKNHIPVKPSTKYKFVEAPHHSFYICYYTQDKTFIRRDTLPWTDTASVITTPSDCYYICFTTFPQYGTTYNHDISVNYPATDVEYHPYVGQTYPITWETEAGTVYGGTLDVVSGVLTVTQVGIRLTSDNQSWSSAGSVSAGTARYYCTLDPAADASAREILCSHAVYVSGNSSAWGTYFVYNGVFAMKNGDGGAGFSSLADFKTWLDENNLQVCYKLATPQTYQLTPTEVRTILGGNTVFTDAGDVSVEYVADTKLYIDGKVAELQALILEN